MIFSRIFLQSPVVLLLISIGCGGMSTDSEKDNVYPEIAYPELISKVADVQKSMGMAYTIGTKTQKDSIETAAKEYLLNVIVNDFFDQWEGTEWDFNGTTRTPKQGKIACGYFITTVLYDVGFDIPRVSWAQQASEYFITRLSTDIKRFSNKPISTVIAYIEGKEDGLYIVGLDSHTGFIYKKGKKIQFVHASYYDPKVGVQSEDLDSENPLSKSAYRVVGKILGKEMVQKWLLDETWK